MENKCPDWLTNDFIAKCLSHEEEFSDINILGFNISPAVSAGNNFGSNIIRVNFELRIGDQVEIKQYSLIVKSSLTEGVMSMSLSETVDCEDIFYREFLSYCNKMIKQSFAPKSFKSPLPSIVILEDLKFHNFFMPDRVSKLDYEHCKYFMNAAALLHAVSFAFCKENPQLICNIGHQKLFDNNVKSAQLMINLNKHSLKALASKIKNEKQAITIRRCSVDLWDLLVDSHKPSTFFNCLTLGDPWTTNMMIKYDEDGYVCDIKLLDFKNVAYGSPAHDVVYFLWSSANHDVRKNRISVLYHIYLEDVNKNLKVLKCPETISHDHFMVDVEKMNSLALWVIGWTPATLQTTPADFEGTCSAISEAGDSLKDNPFEQYYTDNYCEVHLEQTMDELEDCGVFQYLANHLKPINDLVI